MAKIFVLQCLRLRGSWKRQNAYAGRGYAGAPVCVGLDGDVGQSGSEQRTQQLPKVLHLQPVEHNVSARRRRVE